MKSKVGSLDNIKHKPGGGQVKIFSERPKIEAKSKVGSLDNIKHKPGGGQVKVFSEKTNIVAKSKVGSLDNIKHKPGGGNVQVFSERPKIEAKSKVGSLDYIKKEKQQRRSTSSKGDRPDVVDVEKGEEKVNDNEPAKPKIDASSER